MSSRRNRTTVLLLVAWLQLVLQPLAAGAWCSVRAAVGADCCGRPEVQAPLSAGSPGSCCSPDAPANEPPPGEAEGYDEQPGSCDCAVEPVQTPTALPETSGTAAYDGAAPPSSCSVALVPATHAVCGPWSSRARSPGDGPARHLLVQVFRL